MFLQIYSEETRVYLTTRNSVLSTLSFPSVSNILKAIWKPVFGSATRDQLSLQM